MTEIQKYIKLNNKFHWIEGLRKMAQLHLQHMFRPTLSYCINNVSSCDMDMEAGGFTNTFLE